LSHTLVGQFHARCLVAGIGATRRAGDLPQAWNRAAIDFDQCVAAHPA